MTHVGRKPLGPQLVERLQGSPRAKLRLQIMLDTLAGQLTIPAACQVLGISESRFHQLRNQVLQHAVDNLEPRPGGRPANRASAEQLQIAALEAEISQLRAELHAAQIRQEIAQVWPHLAGTSTTVKKTTQLPQKAVRSRRPR